jgi:hypothetical protein
MRFMVMVKATKDSRQAIFPTRSFLPTWESSTKSS